MTTTELLEHLRTEAMKLPDEERRELVRSLQETLDDEAVEFSPEYEDEIARRIERIKNGTAKLTSAEDAIAQVRARFGR